MAKAFLSHSSKDKALVESVAKDLGRQYCVFDKYAFETGEAFLASIEKGLDESSLFVLFLSEHSRDSVWVQFELDEAVARKIERRINRFLVFRIDSSATHRDLPVWLRRTLVKDSAAPKAISRLIRIELDKILAGSLGASFVGRNGDIERLQKALLPLDGQPPPRVLVLFGLDGVGRRTLARKIAGEQFSLASQVEIDLEDGDSLNDIAIKLATELESYNSEGQLRELVAQIQSLEEGRTVSRVERLLRTAITNREFPVFVDKTSAGGDAAKLIRTLVGCVERDNELYAGIISNRRLHSLEGVSLVVQQGLNALSGEETKRLILLLAQHQKVSFAAAQVSELAEYVAGYPPAARHAVKLAADYGSALVLADKNRVVTFRAEAFMRHLSRSNLTPHQRQVLGFLAVYSPLPLSVVGGLTGLDSEVLSEVVSSLMDSAFVEVNNHGHYLIALPVVDSVSRFTGHLDINHARVAAQIEEYMKESEPILYLYRLLFRAQARSGQPSSDALRLANDVHRLARETYDARDYVSAVDWARLAISERPDERRTAETLARALIHLERFEEAKSEIDKMASLGEMARSLFLAGILARAQSDYSKSIELLNAALTNGRKGVAVYRELAQCHLELLQFERAAEALRAALVLEPDNKYLLDMQVKVCVVRKDFLGARRALDALGNVDRPGFYQHRLSTVELAMGNVAAALEAAVQAVQLTSQPAFEMLSQLAKCQIDAREFPSAEETLRNMEKLFAGVKKDIRIGLWCNLEIKKGSFDNALSLWNQLRDKKKPVHQALRVEALKGIVALPQTSAVVREKYILEIASLEPGLKQRSPDFLL